MLVWACALGITPAILMGLQSLVRATPHHLPSPTRSDHSRPGVIAVQHLLGAAPKIRGEKINNGY